MKLTESMLRKIIKEEVQSVLEEAEVVGVDRTNKDVIRNAAKMIIGAEGLEKDMFKHLAKALAGGHKVVLVVGGPKDGQKIDLMKYVEYTN